MKVKDFVGIRTWNLPPTWAIGDKSTVSPFRWAFMNILCWNGMINCDFQTCAVS